MKKTYIIPTLDVVCIETQHMIAVSGPAISDTETTNDVNDLLSRGFDFDDEEEDW